MSEVTFKERMKLRSCGGMIIVFFIMTIIGHEDKNISGVTGSEHVLHYAQFIY